MSHYTDGYVSTHILKTLTVLHGLKEIKRTLEIEKK